VALSIFLLSRSACEYFIISTVTPQRFVMRALRKEHICAERHRTHVPLLARSPSWCEWAKTSCEINPKGKKNSKVP
jgi:hypothetical protein